MLHILIIQIIDDKLSSRLCACIVMGFPCAIQVTIHDFSITFSKKPTGKCIYPTACVGQLFFFSTLAHKIRDRCSPLLEETRGHDNKDDMFPYRINVKRPAYSQLDTFNSFPFDKMAHILQTTFKTRFLERKKNILTSISQQLVPRVLLTISQHWLRFRQRLGAEQSKTITWPNDEPVCKDAYLESQWGYNCRSPFQCLPHRVIQTVVCIIQITLHNKWRVMEELICG